MQQIPREFAYRAEGAHFDYGHPVVSVKDDSARITVSSRQIREPLDVPAEPVVGCLHNKRVDLPFAHGMTSSLPPTPEFRIRYSSENSFIR